MCFCMKAGLFQMNNEQVIEDTVNATNLKFASCKHFAWIAVTTIFPIVEEFCFVLPALSTLL